MAGHAPEYWPFDVPPPDQRTAVRRQLFAFLEDARRDGLRPCRFADGEYLVEAGDRSGWLLYRGRVGDRVRWEVWLNDAVARVGSFRTDDFAAAAVTGWVRGGAVPDLLAVAAHAP